MDPKFSHTSKMIWGQTNNLM